MAGESVFAMQLEQRPQLTITIPEGTKDADMSLTPRLERPMRHRVRIGRAVIHNPDPKVQGLPRFHPRRLITLKKGDEIITSENLEQEFPGKYELVHEPPPRIVSGLRKQQTSYLIQTEKFLEGDRSFLEGLDDADFARILRAAGLSPNVEPPATTLVSNPQEPPVKAVTSILGEDVSDRFPESKKMGYTIWRHPSTKNYWITIGNNLARKLNADPLRDVDVDHFCYEHSQMRSQPEAQE